MKGNSAYNKAKGGRWREREEVRRGSGTVGEQTSLLVTELWRGEGRKTEYKDKGGRGRGREYGEGKEAWESRQGVEGRKTEYKDKRGRERKRKEVGRRKGSVREQTRLFARKLWRDEGRKIEYKDKRGRGRERMEVGRRGSVEDSRQVYLSKHCRGVERKGGQEKKELMKEEN